MSDQAEPHAGGVVHNLTRDDLERTKLLAMSARSAGPRQATRSTLPDLHR